MQPISVTSAPLRSNWSEILAAAVAVGLVWSSAANAQTTISTPTQDAPTSAAPEKSAPASDADDDTTSGIYDNSSKEVIQERLRLEKELKKLRATHFRNVRHVPTRQAGLAKLREYTQPFAFPMLIETFQREGEDVRATLLDMFASVKSDAGDASLAWVAAFGREAAFRDQAVKVLRDRIKSNEGKVPDRVKLVVYEAVQSKDEQKMKAGAQLAGILDIYEAIPWLIPAQVGGQTGGGGGGGDGRRRAKAYIFFGEQTAFVSDLTPVVSESSAAFDPELSVLNTGSVMQIFDAVVVTYHVDIHNILVGLSSKLSGKDTRPLGYDMQQWRRWHAEFYDPWAKEQRAKRAAEHAAQPTPPK
jgi:hypothetical protein